MNARFSPRRWLLFTDCVVVSPTLTWQGRTVRIESGQSGVFFDVAVTPPLCRRLGAKIPRRQTSPAGVLDVVALLVFLWLPWVSLYHDAVV